MCYCCRYARLAFDHDGVCGDELKQGLQHLECLHLHQHPHHVHHFGGCQLGDEGGHNQLLHRLQTNLVQSRHPHIHSQQKRLDQLRRHLPISKTTQLTLHYTTQQHQTLNQPTITTYKHTTTYAITVHGRLHFKPSATFN